MAYYIISIFLSSFLLFQIQPLISKYILPWFGGTTSVWSASLLFFQVLLTGGYAYSFFLIQRLSKRRQGLVHLFLLGVSLTLLGLNFLNWDSPIFPGESWRQLNVDHPFADVIKILFVAVALPYFLLSTNSTLMQAWFNQDNPEGSPYWLYALSNAGSLIGLITYPVLFEPLLSLNSQSILWTFGYILFFCVAGLRALRALRASEGENPKNIPPTRTSYVSTPSMIRYFSWVGFPALASVLLLATTSRITQEVAVIPFLWVLPLTIYLVTFMLSFSGERWYNRYLFLGLLTTASLAYLFVLFFSEMHYLLQITVYMVVLFACAMICHGELYRLRPEPSRLTSFYLMVSIGGALGGIFVNLIAPLIFKGYWEFQIGLVLVWGLMLILVMHSLTSLNPRIARMLVAFTGLGTFFFIGIVFIEIRANSQDLLTSERNFYGVLGVIEESRDDPNEHRYALEHGITIHGFQFQSPEKRTLPTMYFTEQTGVGFAFLNHPARPGNLKVGTIGLGIGVLTAYGHVGDEFRYYEINPAVADIAQSDYFSYLSDTPASVEIILGDGRISLERELSNDGAQNFDLFVVDAFNSDSIPTHLLTKEAFDLYLAHLKPNGILALHISNRHLDLRPVVWELSDKFGLSGLEFKNQPKENDTRSKTSLWILLTNERSFLQDPAVSQAGQPRSSDLPDLRLWTDDYSNLLQILH